MFPFPLTVCDVGGTNARVAVQAGPDEPIRVVAYLRTADFGGLAQAVASVVREGLMPPPASLIVCGAGPVTGRALQLTNAAWFMDGPALASDLSLAQGLLLNDFEAQALALPSIPEGWQVPIGPAMPRAVGNRVVLGPGTGLGVGALLSIDGRWLPVGTEAAHADFGPVGDEEREFWPHIEPFHGRVSAEAVMSGPGLVRLHRARLLAAGAHDPALEGVGITARAIANPRGEEAATVRAFWRLVGRYAGDLALGYLATGGVTLAGGILPQIRALLDPDAFRAAFDHKAPVDAVTRRTPVRLVIEPDAVLVGMAAVGCNPDRYLLDWQSRLWV